MAQDKAQKPPRKRLPKKISEDYLRNAGLYYLQRFAASKAHFKTVMMRKVERSCRHHPEQDIEECRAQVDKLADTFESAGLLNDALYTQGMVNSLRRRGLSRKAILAKMVYKGIAPDRTGQALQEHDNDAPDRDAELGAALMLAKRKKIGPFAVPGKPGDPQKDLARLARAGFSYETARRIMDMGKDFGNDDF